MSKLNLHSVYCVSIHGNVWVPLKELGSYGRSEMPSPQLPIGSAAAFTNTTPPRPTPRPGVGLLDYRKS